MKLKKVMEQDYKLLFPKSKENDNFETMNEIEKEKYLSLYSIYRKLLTEYLIKKIGLKEIDQSIIESGLSFIPINEEDMDFYQYFSADDLKYLYLRNNVYIERLTNEERKFLEERISSEDYNLDKKAEELIERSFRKVISECEEENNKTKVFFGPTTSSYLVSNDSIVIGLRYDEFADTDISDAEWDEQNNNQINYLVKLFNNVIENIKESTNLAVSFIKYNELTVLKKNKIKSNNFLEEER